jgi:hypothetical protein
MSYYQPYEELPRRVQHYVDTIKSLGYTDIRDFQFPCKYFGKNSFGFRVWIDSEEMVQGKIPFRWKVYDIVNSDNGVKDLFGVGYTSISVSYKNKQQLGDKFLPELKKRLKSSEFGGSIHSVRFDINRNNDDPEIYVVLRRGNQSIDDYPSIHNFLTEFIKEKEYPNMSIRIT